MFGLLSSIMYPLGESLDIIVIFPQIKWHECDNIGAIYCMNTFILSFNKYGMDIEFTEKMNYYSLFLIIIIQKRGPWDLTNTIIPIVIYLLISLY